MTAVDLGTPRLRSYSAMKVYHECPRQYELRYVHKLRDEPAVWNIGGTAFHQVVEWYLTDDYTPKGHFYVADAWRMAWDLAKEEVFARNQDANPDISTWRAANQGREGLEWWMKHGPEMVDRFIEWKRTKGAALTVIPNGIEHRFEVELGGVPCVMIPDALVTDEYGQLNILDWKSGRRPPKDSLQLACYRAAVLVGWGMDAVWGHYYLTRKAELLPFDLTRWAVDEIGRMFYEFDWKVNDNQFTPTPGDACKFCPATREHCEFSQKEIT